MKHPQALKKIDLRRIIMMGDSLSDRGTLDRRKILFGLIRMAVLTNLAKFSPSGRFTNGNTWSDALSARLAVQMLIKKLQKEGFDTYIERDSADISDTILTHDFHRSKKMKRQDPCDIADSLIAKESRLEHLVQGTYTLDNDLFVKFQGQDFIRNYDEGGLTAHDWQGLSSFNPKRLFQRNVVANLDEKREKLLRYDAEHKVSEDDKEHTLIIEWSGANDLIVANAAPTEEAVELAVAARKKNVEALIQNGYRQFVLFNLPDLSLTPRYQEKGEAENENARHCSEYFNHLLDQEVQDLKALYPECDIEIFDVSTKLREIYENPEAYGFDPDKRTERYIRSKDYQRNLEERISEAIGYMFWDGVHPTADLHALLSKFFYDFITSLYNIVASKCDHNQLELDMDCHALHAAFHRAYKKTWDKEKNRFLVGRFRGSNINCDEVSLVDILRHGLDEKGERTKRVIMELGWVNAAGELIMKSPALERAMAELECERIRKQSGAALAS